MEKKSKPVAPLGAWVKNRINKLITFFTCVVLIFVSLFMFYIAPFGIGYKYYENEIQIGVTQQKNLVETTLAEYLDELRENGYYICSIEINTNVLNKQTVICKNKINTEQIQQHIINSATIYIFSNQLSIQDDDEVIYYFKSEDECNNFVNNLKEYNENIIADVTNEIVEVDKITNEQTLQDKIEAYRLDREERDRKEAEEKARLAKIAEMQSVTSRSSYSTARVESSSTSQHPLDSYTYISSYFGQRSRDFHTGVDFATPTGTEVHA